MIEVRRALPSELGECHRIRHEVFVVGQNVPVADDLDGLDSASEHFLAFEGNAPIGTARLRHLSAKKVKIERVAVLAQCRGHGAGAKIMDALEARARELGCEDVLLHAQLSVVGFYAKRGYLAEGGEFEDAGIMHQAMRLRPN